MGKREGSPPRVLRVCESTPLSAETSFRELDDVFLQNQTRIWLGEVLHIRFEDEASITDLLADGELLFEVSKVVWEMLSRRHVQIKFSEILISDRSYSGRSSGIYMAYPRIDSFLKVCQIIGLTGVDIFSPSDVVERKDTRRVCMCIRSLSKKARLHDLNIPDFDVAYTIMMPTGMVGCIRKNLELAQHDHSKSNACRSCLYTRPIYRQKAIHPNIELQYDSKLDMVGRTKTEKLLHSPSDSAYSDDRSCVTDEGPPLKDLTSKEKQWQLHNQHTSELRDFDENEGGVIVEGYGDTDELLDSHLLYGISSDKWQHSGAYCKMLSCSCCIYQLGANTSTCYTCMGETSDSPITELHHAENPTSSKRISSDSKDQAAHGTTCSSAVDWNENLVSFQFKVIKSSTSSSSDVDYSDEESTCTSAAFPVSSNSTVILEDSRSASSSRSLLIRANNSVKGEHEWEDGESIVSMNRSDTTISMESDVDNQLSSLCLTNSNVDDADSACSSDDGHIKHDDGEVVCINELILKHKSLRCEMDTHCTEGTESIEDPILVDQNIPDLVKELSSNSIFLGMQTLEFCDQSNITLTRKHSNNDVEKQTLSLQFHDNNRSDHSSEGSEAMLSGDLFTCVKVEENVCSDENDKTFDITSEVFGSIPTKNNQLINRRDDVETTSLPQKTDSKPTSLPIPYNSAPEWHSADMFSDDFPITIESMLICSQHDMHTFSTWDLSESVALSRSRALSQGCNGREDLSVAGVLSISNGVHSEATSICGNMPCLDREHVKDPSSANISFGKLAETDEDEGPVKSEIEEINTCNGTSICRMHYHLEFFCLDIMRRLFLRSRCSCMVNKLGKSLFLKNRLESSVEIRWPTQNIKSRKDLHQLQYLNEDAYVVVLNILENLFAYVEEKPLIEADKEIDTHSFKKFFSNLLSVILSVQLKEFRERCPERYSTDVNNSCGNHLHIAGNFPGRLLLSTTDTSSIGIKFRSMVIEHNVRTDSKKWSIFVDPDGVRLDSSDRLSIVDTEDIDADMSNLHDASKIISKHPSSVYALRSQDIIDVNAEKVQDHKDELLLVSQHPEKTTDANPSIERQFDSYPAIISDHIIVNHLDADSGLLDKDSEHCEEAKVESDLSDGRRCSQSEDKPKKRLLLGSLAGGLTVLGGLFLLSRFRGKGVTKFADRTVFWKRTQKSPS